MTLPSQFPLPFPHRPAYEAAKFLPAPSNEAALTWLERTAAWPDHRLALWGEAGVGKTHLLHVWTARNAAMLLHGPALRAPEPVPLPAGVAIDDADGAADETALLHWLNTARENGVPVLLAARLPPARWAVRLPDLASRLRAITAVPIGPPEDALLRDLLARLLTERRLRRDPALEGWLLLRLPRSPAALREAVVRLDHAAWSAGSGINRRLAAAVVTAMGGSEPEAELDSQASPPP